MTILIFIFITVIPIYIKWTVKKLLVKNKMKNKNNLLIYTYKKYLNGMASQ